MPASPASPPLPLDVLVFGGGIAGLWLLDDLRRRGFSSLLAEKTALGQGQTISSQGIIHGGLKYMFDGHLTPSASIISEMPGLWRACLEGRDEPNLAAATILSDACYIWGTGSIKSRIFMKGSTFALKTRPIAIERAEWPPALKDVPGKVLRVGEMVLEPASLMSALAARNLGRILHVPRAEFLPDLSVRLFAPDDGQHLHVRPKTIILSAGEGNAFLREQAGLHAPIMQRRPLHMTMVRGNLPHLFGHCVGGPKPRVTITTSTDAAGQIVWTIGGQIAEDGVPMDSPQLIAHANRELLACVPGLDLSKAQWATYRVDRAEAATATGQKPDDVHVVEDGPILTAFPTKLALAPRLSQRIIERLAPPSSPQPNFENFPAPPVSKPPWEVADWCTAP